MQTVRPRLCFELRRERQLRKRLSVAVAHLLEHAPPRSKLQLVFLSARQPSWRRRDTLATAARVDGVDIDARRPRETIEANARFGVKLKTALAVEPTLAPNFIVVALVGVLKQNSHLALLVVGHVERTEEEEVADLERPGLAELAKRGAYEFDVAGARDQRLPSEGAVLVQNPIRFGRKLGREDGSPMGVSRARIDERILDAARLGFGFLDAWRGVGERPRGDSDVLPDPPVDGDDPRLLVRRFAPRKRIQEGIGGDVVDLTCRRDDRAGR